MTSLLKLALDFGPLLVFFLTNARSGLYIGTACFIAATTIALGLSWAITRKIALMPLVSALFVLFFGGLTLWLQDDTFIKIKPTLVNAFFSFILLTGLVFKRNVLKIVLEATFQITENGWRLLAIRWGLFFLALALLNEIVWRSVETDTWVAFKVFGILPITLVFSLSQVPLLLKHQIPDAAKDQT